MEKQPNCFNEILTEEIDCLLCNNLNRRIIYKGNSVAIVKCQECSFIYLSPRIKKEYMGEYYKDNYYMIGNDSYKRKLYQREKLKKLYKFKRDGRILDIGCGDGIFLQLAKQQGWETFGTEISKEAVEYATEVRKVNVINTNDIKMAKFDECYFDVITLWHVLEHLYNPENTLQEIHRILKNDGVLVVALPNIESIQSKIFKNYWVHLDIPRHLFHFSEDTIKKFLEKYGFKILRVNYPSREHNKWGFKESFKNYIGRDKRYFKLIKPLISLIALSEYFFEMLRYGASIEIFSKKS